MLRGTGLSYGGYFSHHDSGLPIIYFNYRQTNNPEFCIKIVSKFILLLIDAIKKEKKLEIFSYNSLLAEKSQLKFQFAIKLSNPQSLILFILANYLNGLINIEKIKLDYENLIKNDYNAESLIETLEYISNIHNWSIWIIER